jgi:hypothetical protein
VGKVGFITLALGIMVVRVATADDTAKISVTSATYGGNVDATHAAGNATSYLKSACDGHSDCAYTIDWHIIGDPFVGSLKDFEVQYICGAGAIKRSHVDPEAGTGKTVQLHCP